MTHGMSVSPVQLHMFTENTEEASLITVKNEHSIEESATNFEFFEIEDRNVNTGEFIDIKYKTGIETSDDGEFIEFANINTEGKAEFIEFDTSNKSAIDNEFVDANMEITDDLMIEFEDSTDNKEVAGLESNEEKSFQCDTCNKKFSYKYRLVAHLMLHSEKPCHSMYYIERKPYACDKCTESFVHKTALKFHMRTHSKAQTVVETPQSTKVPSITINKHDEKPCISGTSSSGTNYPCKICDQPFPTKLKLTTHILTHSSDPDPNTELYEVCEELVKPTDLTSKPNHKAYSCKRCYRNFPRPDILEAHMRTHTTKKHTCKTCNKAFGCSTNLKRHMEIHDAERPSFPCLSCSKVYTHKCHLIEHMRTHNGVRPHTCKICDRTFTYRSTLSNHMVTHTGEKPYACDKCDAAFSQISTLKRHLKKHNIKHS